MKRGVKYFLMLAVYAWLRFDLALRLAFKDDWNPRFDFMAGLFGEADARKFLKFRVKLARERKKSVTVIHSKAVETRVDKFLKANPDTKSGRLGRRRLVKKLVFWATDSHINENYVESYKTRMTIADALLSTLFSNAIHPEVDLILTGIDKMVFSRSTNLGFRGEPSPLVHDVIMRHVARILFLHLSELMRLRDEKLDKATKIKLIKELQEAKGGKGSLAFSAEANLKDQYQHTFPLPPEQAKLLLAILDHYRFSPWPDSRETAASLKSQLDSLLGLPLDKLL